MLGVGRLLDKVIRHTSNVILKDDSYRGIMDYADTRTGVFKFGKPKTATWTSKSLLDKLNRTSVKGFSQNLKRFYDTEEDAFLFGYEKTTKNINIKETLDGPKVWNGEDMSTEEMLSICDRLIEQV